MGQSARHNPRPFDRLSNVTADDRATWVAVGDADPDANEILLHAIDAAEQGDGAACPFTNIQASQRWQWMYDKALKTYTAHRQQAYDAGELPL